MKGGIYTFPLPLLLLWPWQNKILKSENDTHEFVAYFQKEMETKDGIIAKLNDELIRKEVLAKSMLRIVASVTVS